MIAAAREEGDEGPAFPFLPGETSQDRANRILGGLKRDNRWGTPMEGPVTDGHAAAVYSAPAHAVPAATRTEHPRARVLFDHTERLPILAAAQALAPTTPSALECVPRPSLDPARLAPTLRLPRAAAGPRPDALPPHDAARFRPTAVLTLVMAVGAGIAIAIAALAILSRPVSSASPASPEPSVLPIAPSQPRPPSPATAPSTFPFASTLPLAPCSSARPSVPGSAPAPAAVPPTALPQRTPERLAPAMKPQPAPPRSKPPIQHETAP